MSEKITDKELIMLIQEHANGKEPEDELIFRAAIELKTYRDLERHGLFKTEKHHTLYKVASNGFTATEMIEKAKDEFCLFFCNKSEECDESDCTIECPLDIL